MLNLLALWIVNALALLALPYVVPTIQVAGFGTALLVAVVLGLINALLRPLLVLLTLPVTLLTLGLFYPWARVRTARYAAEHMTLVACDDLDGFVAARREEVSSLGGELGEMFDVELAL